MRFVEAPIDAVATADAIRSAMASSSSGSERGTTATDVVVSNGVFNLCVDKRAAFGLACVWPFAFLNIV